MIAALKNAIISYISTIQTILRLPEVDLPPLATEEKVILEYIENNPGARNKEIYNALGLSDYTGFHYLSWLLGRGLIYHDTHLKFYVKSSEDKTS